MRTLLLLSLVASSAGAQVLRVAELTSEQIRALDRDKTVVLLPAGVLEQHGPHLPSYADGYQNERMTDAIAEAIAQRSGWKALVFPPIPLGTAGANEIGGSYSWPGTYSIRASTLRSVFMDLADELGTQGFRWAFIIHGHGAPRHNVALDEVEDYFRDTYAGRMIHLMGREPDMSAYDAEYARRITTPFGKEDGDSPHAGIVETSIIAYLRPDLVAPSYKRLRSLTPAARDRLPEVAMAPGWPGYFGAPQFATAEIGRFLVETESREYVTLATRILDGFDERSVPRYADAILAIPGVRAANGRALEHERMIAKRQEDWVRHRAATQPRDSVDDSAVAAAKPPERNELRRLEQRSRQGLP